MGDSFARGLAEAGRRWAGLDTVEEITAAAAEFAAAWIEGCDAIRIGATRRDGRILTLAARDQAVGNLAEFQHQIGQGPSLEAVQSREVIHATDLSRTQRWPDWSSRLVAELGLHTVLSLPLYTTDRVVGVVDLFSRAFQGFSAEAVEAAETFAAHLSVHLVMADNVRNLLAALSNRTVIGQAEGLLMERFQLDPDRAFAILRRVSQDTNTRLAQVAEEFVRTRETPGA